MPYIRKAQAGSSADHVWAEDGAVVEVTVEQAVELLAIPDGGFSEVVEDPKAKPASTAAQTAAQKRVVRKIAE